MCSEKTFSWHVLNEERSRRQVGGTRPLDTLVVVHGDEIETRKVPTSVGRAIRKDPQLRDKQFSTAQEMLECLGHVCRSCAMQSCLRLLQKRDYSTGELMSKLRTYGFDSRVCTTVVEDLEKSDLVSDTRFAEVFSRTKARSGWGLGRIEYELGRRGVDTTTLEDWPHAYIDPTHELDRALSVAERKRVRPPNEYAKLVRFLMGRGFAQGVAMKAAHHVLDQN